MSKTNLVLLLILLQITLVSCGDLFGKKTEDPKLENGKLSANCDLNMDEFANILDKDISSELNCLERNLNIFMDVSELGKGGKLSLVALTKYLKRNKPELDPKTYPVIEAVFALSRLITADEKDYISKKNVSLIMELVRTFNQEAYGLYGYTFGSSAPANLAVHNSHRKRVEAAGEVVKKALEKIYSADRSGEVHFVKTMDVLRGFLREENGEVEKIEGILFVKKILLGGDTKTISHKELGFLFSELPRIFALALDVVRYKDLKLSQREVMSMLRQDTISIENLLFHPSRGDRRFEGFFDVDVAIDGIDRFIKDEDKKLSKYRVLIKEAVRIFTKSKVDGVELSDSEEQWVTGKNLEKIISHSYNITSRALAFHKIYNAPNIRPLLDVPQSVYIDPAKYESQFPENKLDLKEFSRVINTYRYMKGNFDMAYYSLDYSRNADGAAEISIYEYLVKTFFTYYGSSLSMGDKQLRDILKKFENELIEMQIILPRRTRNTADTISLLGSLFQAHSDDNKVLDVDEATEFAISLITAMEAKKKISDFFSTKNCQRDTFNRIEPTCYKENFIEGLCLSYRAHLPRLFEYLGAEPELGCDQDFSSQKNLEYLNTSAQAARPCHVFPDTKEEIFYTEGDMMSMVLAMMHIETTITRWDKNKNNFMDSEELMDAYTIYKPAINGMIPPLPSILDTPKIRATLAKQIYLYLVKYEEIPGTKTGQDIWKLVKFLLQANLKDAPATRKTIASILKIVGMESRKKAAAEYQANPDAPGAEKPFNCNWLHDPENIPRD